MKQTKKLGRGLEDFSHLFLSSPDEGIQSATSSNGIEIPADSAVPVRAHTVCIAGERGAGEKAFLTVSLAAVFAGQGKKVVVFDADFSLPRLCMLMEGTPPNSLLQLITRPAQGKTAFRERDGITLITLDVDVATLAALAPDERLSLMEGLRKSVGEAGAVLVMTSGDFMNGTRIFIEAADDIVVVTPQPVAEMINAYGVIKKILQIDERARVGIVACRSTLFHHADAVFEKMQRVVQKFLDKPLLNHGYLPDDQNISGFLNRNRPAAQASPSSETARCLAAIAQSLVPGEARQAAHPPAEAKLALADKLFT
jgi:flagellar biosynthesis protein FlhG